MSAITARAPIVLRTVTPFDRDFLYTLACDPETRAQSLDPHVPTPDEHAAWLTALLASKDHPAWIALSDWNPAAFVHIQQIARLGGKLSVVVHPDYRGKGIGSAAIYHATLLVKEYADWGVLASVKPENLASRQAFLNAGYTEAGPGIERGQDVIVYAKG